MLVGYNVGTSPATQNNSASYPQQADTEQQHKGSGNLFGWQGNYWQHCVQRRYLDYLGGNFEVFLLHRGDTLNRLG